jgi:hypothetical protein
MHPKLIFTTELRKVLYFAEKRVEVQTYVVEQEKELCSLTSTFGKENCLGGSQA